jgi:CheY-like chemotaxis protein
MPRMDGFTASTRIREFEASQHLPPKPIIAMTAFTMPEDQAKCLASGMSDYISKPFSKEGLRDVVEKHLPAGKAKPRDETGTLGRKRIATARR